MKEQRRTRSVPAVSLGPSLSAYRIIDAVDYQGDVAMRGGFSLIESSVEDQISEITIFIFITYSGSPMSESY